MSVHSSQHSTDLDVLVDQLLSRARQDTRLAAILCRQARRILAFFGEPHEFDDAPGEDNTHPASSDDLGRLMAWSRQRQGRSASGMLSVSGEPDAEHSERYQELADVCRLKGRAADWRACALAGEHAPQSEREALIHEASDNGVFLWTVTRSQDGRLSRDAMDYERLAESYFAGAEALEAWGQISLEEAPQLLPLIAEAQSMIRVAANRTGHRRREDSAEAIHAWLCEVAAEIKVYIPRFMKVGEAADPDQVADLRERIAALLAQLPDRSEPISDVIDASAPEDGD